MINKISFIQLFYLKPTDITTAGDLDEENEGDEDDEEKIYEKSSSFLQMTNIFGQSFVGSAAFRVRKDEKEVSIDKRMIKFNLLIVILSSYYLLNYIPLRLVLLHYFIIFPYCFKCFTVLLFSVVYCSTGYKARSSMLRAWRNTIGMLNSNVVE